MNGPIDQINNIISPGSYLKITGGAPAERAGPKAKGNIAKTSAKYIVENNKIVFERYDRYGKLISRVPWAARSISEKA
jgi:hypothetical protein